MENNKKSIIGFLKDIEKTKTYLEHNYKDLQQRHDDYLGFNDYTPENFGKLRKIIDDYTYSLINYLSSYSTLIDHMMRVRNSLDNEQITKEYETNLKNGLNDEQKFTKDLRNYFSHYRLPLLDPRFGIVLQKGPDGWEPGGVAKDGFLSVKKYELLKWKRWKKDSLVFLNGINTYEDKISLQPLIDRVHNSILEFLNWFRDRIISQFPIM
jgi:hypothetical protein